MCSYSRVSLNNFCRFVFFFLEIRLIDKENLKLKAVTILYICLFLYLFLLKANDFQNVCRFDNVMTINYVLLRETATCAGVTEYRHNLVTLNLCQYYNVIINRSNKYFSRHYKLHREIVNNKRNFVQQTVARICLAD